MCLSVNCMKMYDMYRFTSSKSTVKEAHPLDPAPSEGGGEEEEEGTPRTIVLYVIGGISPIELVQLEEVLRQFKNSQKFKVIVGSTNMVAPIDILYNVCINPCL